MSEEKEDWYPWRQWITACHAGGVLAAFWCGIFWDLNWPMAIAHGLTSLIAFAVAMLWLWTGRSGD